MAVPIYIVHWGNNNYLKYCIHQARHFNPKSEIILIGDKSNKKYHFVKHYHASGYSFNAKMFLKFYVHLNMTIPSWYVRLWLKRWFVLRDFMKIHHYGDQFIYIDSDVLLYCDVTREFEKFRDHPMTICGHAPHCTYFNGAKPVEDLCDYINAVYTEPEKLKLFTDMYEKHKLNNKEGGIDDMTIISEYSKLHPGQVGDHSSIIDGATYEDNMCDAQDFEYDKSRKIKKIYRKDGLPYGKHLPDGNLIRFNALHFAGGSKKYMARYYSGPDMYIQKMFSEMYYGIYAPIRKQLRRK